MKKFPFRAVISDLDGTLLNAHHQIGDFTIDTLNKLEKLGIDIMIATGRNHIDVSSIFTKIGAKNAVMITSNGARSYDLAGNLLYANNLPQEIAFDIMNLPIDSNNVCLNSYQGEGWFINKDIPTLRQYHQDSGFMYNVVDFKKHHGHHTEKIFFIGKTLEHLLPIEQTLKSKYGDKITVVYSTPQCLEVMNQNVSKATTLAAIVATRDYSLSDCIAFGDGLNDEEMLKAVGKGHIMENADPRLKIACAELTQIGDHKHEAVASYLRATFGVY